MAGENILIVDDEKEITELIEVYLRNDGYQPLKCYNASDALRMVGQSHIDLAILDVMLPDMDGFTLCRKIREKYFFPIILLTAKVENQDKINGLTMGADDYMTKPFLPLELVARVKTQLRRYIQYNTVNAMAASKQKQEYNIRGLCISKENHRCTVNGAEVALTPIEFGILWYLCEHQGEVVSAEQLFEKVWGERYLENNNTVMTHIARLREKMKEPARRPKYIKTVWGVGYTIE